MKKSIDMSTSTIKYAGAKDNSSTVKIGLKDGKIVVSGSISTLAKVTDKGMSCYITGFDIFFRAKDEDERRKKVLTFVKFYLDNFLLFSNKNALRRLVMDLNKKGFRADNHNAVMYELVNNKVVPANFKIAKPKEPNDFAGADVFSEHFERAA